MTFEEALAVPGTKVVASGSEAEGMRALMIYSLSDSGAKELAADMLPVAEHDALRADFTARGCGLAETDIYTDIVWVPKQGGGIAVYDKERKLFDAEGESATLANGTVVARADIENLIAWASDDYVRRGIKALVRSGKEVELVTELSTSAYGDPTYSRNELLGETEWCGRLGVAIATWANTGLDNQI